MCNYIEVASPKYIVRSAINADLPQIIQLDYEAFSPYGTSELPTVIKARLKVFPEGLMVVENNGIIVGYGSTEKWLEERDPAMNEDPLKSHHPSGRILCITAMAVKKDYRRHGLGSLILEEIKVVARKQQCERLILETTHAQEFYLKKGFQFIGKREQMGASLTILSLCL